MPTSEEKSASLNILVDSTAPAPPKFQIPAGYILVGSPGTRSAQVPPAKPDPNNQGNAGVFLLTAFGLGLAAGLTPCVFPMIAITVTFFLSRRAGVTQAATFALGIVFLFCGIGLGITALTGPFGVVRLGASPWVNGFIAAVFAIFAISLLGAFEITLPSGLLTRLDHVSRRDGYLGTLLMGLTFSFTAFACVGPFVGSLLAASVQTPGSRTLLGMFSFATGLSSPFFFLAAFPSCLKKLPKSGQWMVRVKVVMGFILLVAMLKYLSNVDQVLQIGFLSRERVLAAWLVLFSLAGFYLLGLLRLEGVSSQEPLGVGRVLVASLVLCLPSASFRECQAPDLASWKPTCQRRKWIPPRRRVGARRHSHSSRTSIRRHWQRLVTNTNRYSSRSRVTPTPIATG